MATLIIPPKVFAKLMRDVYGFRDLKVNRIIENALKPKNKHTNVCINLDPLTKAQITSFVHANDPAQPKDDKYALARWYNDLADRANNGPIVVGLPCIEYSPGEWQELTVKMTDQPSSIFNLNLYRGRSIPMDLNPYLEGLSPLFRHMLSKGSRSKTAQPVGA
jgi:hypothetical protein